MEKIKSKARKAKKEIKSNKINELKNGEFPKKLKKRRYLKDKLDRSKRNTVKLKSNFQNKFHKKNKALKRGNYEEMKELHCKAVEILDCERACDVCGYDDFGYCGLRSASIPYEEIFSTICFPSLLKAWEMDLSKL